MISGTLRALVFDLDGTLYDQSRLRSAMALRMLAAFWCHPRHGAEAIRAVSAYRRAQETIRRGHAGPIGRDLAGEQLRLAAEKSGVRLEAVQVHVRTWMEERPLPLLARAVRPGLFEFFAQAEANGVRLGLFSDYPPAAKLEAMGLAGRFEVVSCAQEPEIGRFKPDPAGIHHVLQRLGVSPGEALYVGDRPDVDVPAARAAGVRCVIVGVAEPGAFETHQAVRGFRELQNELFSGG